MHSPPCPLALPQGRQTGMAERRHAHMRETLPAPLKMTGPVLAGVIPGQLAAVTQHAASLAISLGVELVFAYVDVTTYLVAEEADGTVESASVDPDGVDDGAERTAAAIRSRIAGQLGGFDVRWTFTTLASNPAQALGRLAETIGACVIVVGTLERGIGARLAELLTGSVAVHLTHRQGRPVLVIPLDPHLAYESGRCDRRRPVARPSRRRGPCSGCRAQQAGGGDRCGHPDGRVREGTCRGKDSPQDAGRQRGAQVTN